MQFLYQQLQQMGGQVKLTNQGLQAVQAFCQQRMAEMGARQERWQQEVTQECQDVCLQSHQGLEVRVYGESQQRCEAWLRQMAHELRPADPT